MPWWGSKLYDPEVLQKRTSLIAFSSIRPLWRRVLLVKRSLLIVVFILNVLLIVFSLAVIALLLYMSFVTKRAHESQWVAPLLASLCLSAIVYSETHSTVCLFYFLFVDKRDIEKVLRSQINYGVQHNIAP